MQPRWQKRITQLNFQEVLMGQILYKKLNWMQGMQGSRTIGSKMRLRGCDEVRIGALPRTVTTNHNTENAAVCPILGRFGSTKI
jgi:hypothetical protein